jgi:hypothetical protein
LAAACSATVRPWNVAFIRRWGMPSAAGGWCPTTGEKPGEKVGIPQTFRSAVANRSSREINGLRYNYPEPAVDKSAG